jgi:hypothetical protein
MLNYDAGSVKWSAAEVSGGEDCAKLDWLVADRFVVTGAE